MIGQKHEALKALLATGSAFAPEIERPLGEGEHSSFSGAVGSQPLPFAERPATPIPAPAGRSSFPRAAVSFAVLLAGWAAGIAIAAQILQEWIGR